MFYFFDNRPDFTIIDFKALRERFINGDEIDIEAVFADKWSKEHEQKKAEQHNETWGLCVPITYFINTKIGKQSQDTEHERLDPASR